VNEDSAPQLPPMPPIPQSGRLAGVDFGTVRIGIAISDPGQSIASPLETYNRRTESLDAKYFQELAKTEQLVGFVVGLPVHMSGDASEKSAQAVQFGTWIFEQTEEMSGKKRKSMLDKIAAQILLSAYMESGSQGVSSLDEV